VTPESRTELERERDFLLRSLDDLDDERAAGNIDDGTYDSLHADYTARASLAIRELQGADVELPDDEPRVSVTRSVFTVGGVIAFCVVLGVLLAHAVGQRSPGQTITGNNQVNQAANGTVTTADTGAALRAAATAAPHDYNAQIAYARYLLGVQAYPQAIEQYTTAAGVDPAQPEPYAYRGWLTSLVAAQVTDPKTHDQLVQRASSDLDHAISLDKTYPDPYVFEGLMLMNVEQKPAQAIPFFQKFLAVAPADHPMRAQVETALQQARAAAPSNNH
jgi:cytochrome c-type biogenesis protein CcmH/NrfG